jgi:hypothetical protein
MHRYPLTEKLCQWLLSWDHYPAEERAAALSALQRIRLNTSIRSFFASTYRARIATLGARQLTCFDDLVGPLDHRPMAFIPMRQGLVALLVYAILTSEGDSLWQDLYMSGRLSGESFLCSPTGQAISMAIGQDLSRLKDYMSMVLGTVYDRGQASFQLSSDTCGRVIIDQIGCPAIQHWVWRGGLAVIAERAGATLRAIRSDVLDDAAFFVELDWSQDPNTPPPDLQERKRDSDNQLRKVRSRSGMFHAALAPFQADTLHAGADVLRTYALTDEFHAWLQAQPRFSVADRAQISAAFSCVNPLEGVRAFHVSRCRSLLPAHTHASFDRLIGPLPERDMDFIPVSQGLVAMLITGCHLSPLSATLSEVMAEAGQWQGVLFVRSPTGQALRRVIDEDFSMIFKQFNTIISTIYNRARAQVEVLEAGHARVTLAPLSVATLHHAGWRGVMKGVAAELGVQLLHNHSGASSNDSAFLDVRWHDPRPATPPPPR